MAETFYIAEQRQLPEALNYEWLRAEGMRHIEQMGNQLWTDYNAHDPGITLLEAMVYVLTELGYRNSFDIADLLTAKDGLIKNNTFFTAKNSLTTAPVSVLDYRKLLIDMEGIANAWFIPTQNITDANGYLLPHEAEETIFVNVKDDKLSFQHKNSFGEELTDKLHIRGLNKIKLELEEDVKLGNLNSTVLEYAIYVNEHWLEMTVSPNFKLWQDEAASFLNKTIDKASFNYFSTYIDVTITFKNEPVTSTLVFHVQPKDSGELGLLKSELIKPNATLLADIMLLMTEKRNKVNDILAKAMVLLQQNRNIGEDYLCLDIVKEVNIAVCADIQLEANTNPLDILVRIHALIDDLFSPPVPFYTLKELMDKGMSTTEIFNGPVLSHGFINDKELQNTSLPTCLHSSDIIAAIMNLDGVLAVNNVLLTALDDEGKPLGNMSNQPWTLTLDGQTKARFSTRFSRLSLFKEQLPIFIHEKSQKLIDEQFQIHLIQKRNLKLALSTTDLDIPTGTYLALNEYYSIQEELPSCYAVGHHTLSPDAGNEQKAQAKQLKAYLHFFDQILADVFSQLYHAKHLFDTGEIHDSYFPQYLEKDFKTGLDYVSKEIYGSTWENAVTNPFLLDTEEEFLDRRNRVLDHLMARFAESFSDYAYVLFQVQQDLSIGNRKNQSQYELIEDKIDFLNSYASTSYERGNAMDYLNASWNGTAWTYDHFWNAEHRSGYELRVAKLLGIDETSLTNIFPDNAPQTEWVLQTSDGEVRIKIQQPNIDLAQKWEWLQLNISDAEVYSIEKLVKNYSIFLGDGNLRIAKVDMTFSSLEEAEDMINSILQAISDALENFYFLEHILLRPFQPLNNDSEDLLTVCLNDECFNSANIDPYSFKATVVLPGYMSRFRNLTFRKYAEQIFRQEAPAHLLLKICWVGKDDMILFQNAYRTWLDDYRKFRIAYCNQSLTKEMKDTFIKNHKQLLQALKHLNTIYPEGNLYDCETSTTTTPIILGQSSLGTLT